MEEAKLLRRVKDPLARKLVEQKMGEIKRNPNQGELVKATRKSSRVRRQKAGQFRITFKLVDEGVEFVDVSPRHETYNNRRLKG